MRPDAQERSDLPSRRHGRARRWLVRPFFWGLALLALLFFASVVYLESEHFRRQGQKWATDWLEERLQRQVRASEMRLELFPLMVELREVEVAGNTSDAAPFARAGRVLVEATVGPLPWPGIVLDHILVEGPEITVGFDEEGQHDAPRWDRRRRLSEQQLPFDVEIGRLDIVDGSFDLGHEKYPLDLSARDVRAELTGGQGLELRGRATASEVEVQLPQARPYIGRVELDATFRKDRVDVRQARIDGPDLSATLSGIWQWRSTKDLDLRVVADSRLEMFDRLGYLSDLGTGSVHFEGNLRRRPGEWFLDGDFSAPTVTVLGRRFDAVVGRTSGDERSLRLDIEESRYGGGSVIGAVVVPLAREESRPVTVDLQLSEVDLIRLLEDQAIPVGGLAATASGPVEYRFRRARPRLGDGSADLEISGGDGGSGGLPVFGAAPLRIEGGVIRSEAIRLTSVSQGFLAGGYYDLGSSAGEFEYSITTRKVQELFSLLPALGEEPELWRPHVGAGSLAGTLVIAEGAAISDVRIDLEEVEAPGYSASRLLGGLRLAAGGVENLRLELSRPSAAMIVTGHVPFEGDPSAQPLLIAIESAGWPVEDVESWLPWRLDVAGGFTGGLELGGSMDEPRGMLQGVFEPARLGRIDARSLDLSLEFDSEEVEIREARVALGAGDLEAEGEVRLSDGEVRLRLASKPLDLSLLPVVGELAGNIGGDLEVSAALEGPLDSPSLNGVVECHNIVVGGTGEDPADSSRISVEWSGGHLEIDGSFGRLFDIRGGGRFDSEGADLTFAVESGRLGDLLVAWASSATSGVSGHGRGSLRLEAAWKAKPQLTALLRLDRLEVERGDQRLENLETVVLALDGDGIQVQSLYLGEQETGSETFVSGRVGRGGSASVNLNLQASLASEWFAPWLPNIDMRGGVFEVIGTIGGSVDNLRLNGQGELREARALVSGFPSSLEKIRGMVLFYPGRIVLDDGVAQMAGGWLRAGGTIELRSGGDASYRFQVSGEDLSFRYPEGWLIRGDTELTVASTPGGRQISGAARLDNALYVRDVQLIKSIFERRRVEEGDLEPWRSETQLNLVIEAPDGLRVRNNLADLNGGAELGLRGSLARPVLFGTVELQKGGRLTYAGQEYTVERGLLNFTNPFRIEPVLDLLATTRMREYDVTLSLSGTPERLQTEFVSNPPLAEMEVLALLTGGRSPENRESGAPDDGIEGGAAESFLYGQATSLIAGRFNRLFGLDQFRIDPLTSSSGALSSARVTVGKQLSRDLFVTYSYDPSQTEEQILELEWRLSRSLLLVLTQNGDGTYAVDARWEKAL